MGTTANLGYMMATTYEPKKPKVRKSEIDKRLTDARAQVEGQKKALLRLR